MDGDCVSLLKAKSVSCKICQDEDEDSNMEAPCSCSGTLKYAHRECVQRWCNEKGDITCEICLQQFEPDYAVPPPWCHYGGLPLNNRGNWEVSRRDLHDHQSIDMAADDHDFMDFDHVIGGAGDQTITFSVSLLLSIIGIFLPIFVMAKAINATINYRRRQQEFGNFGLEELDEENELPRQVQPQPHLFHDL